MWDLVSSENYRSYSQGILLTSTYYIYMRKLAAFLTVIFPPQLYRSQQNRIHMVHNGEEINPYTAQKEKLFPLG